MHTSSNDNNIDRVKTFTFHGLTKVGESGNQVIFPCPYCNKWKMYVNKDTGQWDCKVCGISGNHITFLRTLHAKSLEFTTDKEYQELATNRKIPVSVLKEWGAAKSVITNLWLIPGYNHNKQLVTLYRYIKNNNGGMFLQVTVGCSHALHGLHTLAPKKKTVYICEGFWDGACFWHTLGNSRRDGDNLKQTCNKSISLQSSCSVIAVPSSSVFKSEWTELLRDKDCIFLYDSDHPTTKNPVPPGYSGVIRAVQNLYTSENTPSGVAYLHWGSKGYDPKLPSGTDVRDVLTKDSKMVHNLGTLLGNIRPYKEEWLSKAKGVVEVKKAANQSVVTLTQQTFNGIANTANKLRKQQQEEKEETSESVESPTKPIQLTPLPCEDWDTLVTSWKKCMKWIEGLDRAFSVMLACITSTNAVGDNLWVKIISPAASGKSTLCEALSANKTYVVAKSTIRGFHSGYQTDESGTEDNSLLSKLKGMTLITKDGDTLLQSPNLSQILAEARDVYDKVSRTSYRNKASRDYEGINLTWILCGTSSLRALDQSELGERFLDCVIMEEVNEDLEDMINMRVAIRTIKNLQRANDKESSQEDADMTRTKQLTSGYINYLRENADTLLSQISVSDEAITQCVHMATFVAYMRARPSQKQDESAERELASRLVSQHTRLAMCLAVVLNRDSVDEEVLRRTRRTAMDTARGKTLKIVEQIYKNGTNGTEVRPLAIRLGEDETKLRHLLRFMKKIKILDVITDTEGNSRKPRWVLTPKLTNLYEEVVVRQHS